MLEAEARLLKMLSQSRSRPFGNLKAEAKADFQALKSWLHEAETGFVPMSV